MNDNDLKLPIDDLPPHEETAIDALLREAIGDVRPKDFAPLILDRLRNESHAPIRPVTRISPTKRRSKSRRVGVSAAIMALAASVAAIVVLRPDPVAPKIVAGNDAAKPTPVQTLVTEKTRATESSGNQSPAPRPPVRGVPMTMPDLAASTPKDGPQTKQKPNAKPLAKPLELNLVSRQVEDQFESYWASIGIRPSDVAGSEELANRWSELLGVKFSPADVAGVDAIASRLDDPRIASVIADRWLNQITEGGSDRLPAETKQSLVDVVSGAMIGNGSFREIFAGWVGGDGTTSSAFWTAMAGDANRLDDGAVARRLASVSLDADLRCTRCHDALIEGNGRQRDHWGLVAVLDQGLVKTDNGWTRRSTPTAERTFYDSIDGLKRVAAPGIAWISEDVGSMADWASELADPNSAASRRLSGGVVNSLWQLVHGRPLQGRVIDPVSAPHSEALSGLENELGDDLRRSGFDLGRTLSLILASPATRRVVPASLENAWAIDNAADREAAEAFAAARPIATRLPSSKRLDQTMRAVGAKLGTGEGGLLAQLGDASGNLKAKTDAGLSWDFPDRAESLPVQWLGRIKSLNDQVDHVAYLAGRSETPTSIREAAEVMQSAGLNRETLLHRVWWLVK